MGKTQEATPVGHDEGRGRPRRLTEDEKVFGILAEHRERFGVTLDCVKVGDVGWRFRRRTSRMKAFETRIVGLDVDDATIWTTKIKELRKNAYRNYLSEEEISVPDDVADDLMERTYQFVQGPAVGRNEYAPDNHAVVLDWVTRVLAAAGSGPKDEAVRHITDVMRGIASGHRHETDPFVIEGRLLHATGSEPVSPKIKGLFEDTLEQIPIFPEVANAIAHITSLPDGERPYTLFFSMGYIPEQLKKILIQEAKDPRIQVDEFWISRDTKDVFIEQMLSTGANEAFPIDYPEGVPQEGGHILGEHPHCMVMLDDSKASLRGLDRANAILKARGSGAEIELVRSKRQGAKDGNEPWGSEQGDYAEIDFDRKPMTGEKLVRFLLGRIAANFQRRFGRIPAPRSGEASRLGIAS